MGSMGRECRYGRLKGRDGWSKGLTDCFPFLFHVLVIRVFTWL